MQASSSLPMGFQDVSSCGEYAIELIYVASSQMDIVAHAGTTHAMPGQQSISGFISLIEACRLFAKP